MIDEFIQNDQIVDYLSGRKKFPEKYGILGISEKSSKSDIRYYDWDMTFSKGLLARRPDNSGNDEIQIIFNLNEAIEWDIISDAGGQRDIHVKMDAGDVCIYRNNDAKTGMVYEAGTNFRFKSLQMSTERFNRLISANFDSSEGSLLRKKIFEGIMITAITPSMYRIMSELDSADSYGSYKPAFLEVKLTELTILVMYSAVSSNADETPSKRTVSREDKNAVRDLYEQIHLKPYESFRAEDLASELSMSVSKLNRIFKSLYDTSLHSYVTARRLEYAADLITREDCSISEAAYRSGYNNLSHFSKAFSKKFGVTPRCYRKKQK